MLVEGESDCHTLWQHDIPALGIPGATTWRDEWSELLPESDPIYVVFEPDQGGRSLIRALGNTQFADRLKVIRIEGAKDPSELHLQSSGSEDFVKAWGKAIEAASPIAVVLQELADAESESVEVAIELGRSPVITRLSDVEPEEIDWLIEPYLALGKLSLLDGDPGKGKTTLALWMAARLSRGDLGFALGQGGAVEPQNVLYLTGEDDLADTIRPRLDSMGANAAKIAALEGRRDESPQPVPISFQDVDVIRSAIECERPKLVVVDPLTSFLGSGVDMYRANEVRPVVAAIAGLAAEYRCSILLIRHLKKARVGGSALHGGIGSVDFTAIVRTQLLFGSDPEDPERLILAQSKCNLGKMGRSLAFRFSDEGVFEFEEESSLTADDILSASSPSSADIRPAEVAEAFIRQQLEGGARQSKQLEQNAKLEGISARTLNRAKKKLGIKSRKVQSEWWWVPPDEWSRARVPEPLHSDSGTLDAETAPDSISESGGHVGGQLGFEPADISDPVL